MNKQKLSINDVLTLILMSATIFGTWLRIMPAWIAGFPINDGGMFYTMIQDLQANHYSLPLFTSYNQQNIPFVYPPLGFYIGAAITDLFNLSSPMSVIQWLPGILNSLCIPAFYLFAKEISGSKLQSTISTLVFSFIPHMTAWFSMGGGLTRSLGAIFMLLALVHIHRVFAKESKQDVWAAIIFSSLATLSHTEAPIYTIAIAVYMWAMKSRSVAGLKNGCLVTIGVIVLITPWLYWIISRHGLDPIISASHTGFRSSTSIFRIINVDFITEEYFLDIFGTLGVLGIAILVAKRHFFLPGMLAVIFLVHPRSAHTIGNIPLAMAAGYLIANVLILSFSKGNIIQELKNRNLSQSLTLILAVLSPYILSNSLYYGVNLSQIHVSDAQLSSMQWVTNNTSAESKYLVITGETNGFCDSISEWFPTLTGRKSIATLQGTEWLKGDGFSELIRKVQKIQACNQYGATCIISEAYNLNLEFDYIFISFDTPTTDCITASTTQLNRNLAIELTNSAQFELIFFSEETAVFSKR